MIQSFSDIEMNKIKFSGSLPRAHVYLMIVANIFPKYKKFVGQHCVH
jgi:hypothetical protein